LSLVSCHLSLVTGRRSLIIAIRSKLEGLQMANDK
jgi:hypothetical protein